MLAKEPLSYINSKSIEMLFVEGTSLMQISRLTYKNLLAALQPTIANDAQFRGNCVELDLVHQWSCPYSYTETKNKMRGAISQVRAVDTHTVMKRPLPGNKSKNTSVVTDVQMLTHTLHQ